MTQKLFMFEYKRDNVRVHRSATLHVDLKFHTIRRFGKRDC